MTYPTNFATLTAGNQPLSDFDTMFAIVGQMGNIPTTAAGTNAISLTVNTNYYSPASYTNAQLVSFLATGNSTGSVTVQIGGLGFVPLYKVGGAQAGSGDIVSGTHYTIQYWSDLNTGSGGFLLINSGAGFASLTAQDQTLSGGANVTPFNLGTGSGTLTVDCGKGPLQYINNRGSFTIAPPANDGTCMILISMSSVAGTITLNATATAWVVGDNIGDNFNYSTGNNFTMSVWRINGVPSFFVKGMQ